MRLSLTAVASLLLLGCSSKGAPATGEDAGLVPAPTTPGQIRHVILVVQENHTFDTYFGRYCKAVAGSNPSCTAGPACCEAIPDKDPSGATPRALGDDENGSYDPNHTQACEVAEMNGGKMDRYVTGAPCSDPRNFAVAGADVVKPYHDLASGGALADRYFQSLAGQSSANDMYFAAAKFVFNDNDFKPDTIGKECSFASTVQRYEGKTTVFDVLSGAGKTANVYAEGYARVKAHPGSCPTAPDDCPVRIAAYPCNFDPSDIPYLYYAQFASSTSFMKDYADLASDVDARRLPDVAFVKALGFHTEHPGVNITISAGAKLVSDLAAKIASSAYRDDTLVLVTWDEGGGFFDHVSPPAASAVDGQPYGTRVPLLALGRFAKKGAVSHVEMEHSSIVKFLEWNFTGNTGQLGGRDAVVNGIGSLLDPAQLEVPVPER